MLILSKWRIRAEETEITRKGHKVRAERNIPMPGPGDMHKTEPTAAVERRQNY